MSPIEITPLPPEARKVFTGEIFSVWQWPQKLYDGTVATFERISRADSVMALGVLPNKKILLIRDTQPDRGALITAAGGVVDPGETPETAARRELLEETGYAGEEMVPWFAYRPSVKTEYLVHAFIVKNVVLAGPPAPEAGEKIELLTYSFDEFLELGKNDDMRDWNMRIQLLMALTDKTAYDQLYSLCYD